MKIRRAFISFVFGLGLLLVLGLALISASSADPATPQAELHVCASGCPYSSVQAAVDAANAGDIIKIAAGNYTDVVTRSNLVQAVYIDKNLTLRGGFTTSDWNTYNPTVNLTTLNAQQLARVIYIRGNINVTVEGLRITGGQPHSWSGTTDYFADGGGIYIVTATATLKDNVVFANTVGGPGFGGIILRNGGGVYLSNSPTTLINNQIISNTATGAGAGLYLGYSNATLNGNTIAANNSGDNGGGLYLVYSPATLTGNTIAHNQASSDAASSGNGGGLGTEDSAIILSGNTFMSNTASYAGGGLSLHNYYRTNATLSGNTFVSNTAQHGGGLSLSPGTGIVTFSGNLVKANSASWDSGGLTIGGGTSLNNNTISDNSAPYNGGGLSGSGAVTLTGNLISGNRTTGTGGKGGGVYLSYSSAMLSSNIITGNASMGNGSGGGLYLSHSPVNLNGNRILSNTAFDGYGAFLTSGSDATFVNTVIADNIASYKGCTTCYGVSIQYSSPRFLHTTLARNTGLAAIYLTDWNGTYSNIALTNTIIVSHALGVKATAGNTATLNGVLWFSNTANTSGGVIAVTNAITGNPKFDLDGYHILSGSLAIDHGVNAGVTTDIDNQARPNGLAPDLGADEWYPPLDKHVFLPLVIK